MAPIIKPGEAGFTYIAALCILVILSVLSLRVAEEWTMSERRQREDELLYIGHQFRQAIALYYAESPGSQKRYPHELSDLLLDRNLTRTARPLRKIFIDPMTRTSEWGLVMDPKDGVGIIGVYSRSTGQPIKQDNFAPSDAAFKGAKQYQDWKFVFTPDA
ncbi:type II secretion system GspH family protein [Burkholderiaceae bacterium DAT-1]|nr:type II secretion system GspH family protein [Burkholderiaceae bacterium DAT-1]